MQNRLIPTVRSIAAVVVVDKFVLLSVVQQQ